MQKIKIPAKLNLTLDITGQSGGYHTIDSLVCSVNLYDTILVSKRKDKKILLKSRGINPECLVENNNAYKTALLFCEKENANGVKITIKKNIPVANGLGGSSADVAGTLLALKKLYKTDTDLSELANAMGSDCNYMLGGGFARLKGRGEEITKLNGRKLYFVIIPSTEKISAKDCYKSFDSQTEKPLPCTEQAIDFLLHDDFNSFAKTLKNDLYLPATKLCPLVKESVENSKQFGYPVMTGSGSAVYLVFRDKKGRNKAYKKLKKSYKKLIKAQTV